MESVIPLTPDINNDFFDAARTKAKIFYISKASCKQDMSCYSGKSLN